VEGTGGRIIGESGGDIRDAACRRENRRNVILSEGPSRPNRERGSDLGTATNGSEQLI